MCNIIMKHCPHLHNEEGCEATLLNIESDFWTHNCLGVRGTTGSLQITIEHLSFNKIIQVLKDKHLKLFLLTLVTLHSPISAGTTAGSWGTDMRGLNPHTGSSHPCKFSSFPARPMQKLEEIIYEKYF